MKFLKTIASTLLGILLLASSTSAQSNKLENSLLWKIEKKNTNTSYLFGTIHLISESDYFMPEKAEKAFAACKKLVLEIDISDQQQVMQIMNYAHMKDGITLQDLFTENDYALLDSTMLVITGMSVSALNTFKPFVLESFLIQNVVDGPTEIYEMSFANMATDIEMPIIGLESIQGQMQLFDDLPYEEQAADLMKYVRGDEDMKKLFAEMVEMYKSQNISALYNYMADYFPDERWMQKLLFERNANWIPLIEDQMATGSIFVAVGAGHLGGEQGVIALLRKAGYKVTAVK